VLDGCEAPARAYDLIMLDLDGVVYVGPDAVPGAADHLRRAREGGAHLAFVTNNAARPPHTVADHLTRLGVEAAPADVVTSAQAAARMARERLAPGGRVFLLGGPGLEEALTEEGLQAVQESDPPPDLVVSGYGPDLRWSTIMRGAMLVRDGVPWIAANTDRTVPLPDGIGPGHGALVELVARFAGVEPAVAGKPARPLLDETIRRVGGDRPLMVGDRLDTDLAGARVAGVRGLLVLTGVTGLAELVAADPAERPHHVAVDLGGLFEAHPAVVASADGGVDLGGWRVQVDAEGELVATGDGSPSDWWRAVAVAAWAYRDAAGGVPGIAGLTEPVA